MGIVVSRHLSERIEAVAEVTGLSRTIVENVLKADKDFIWDTLREGKRAVVLGVVSLTPASTEEGVLTVRGRVSGGLRGYLNGFYAPEGLPVIEGTRKSKGSSEDNEEFSETFNDEDEEI